MAIYLILLALFINMLIILLKDNMLYSLLIQIMKFQIFNSNNCF